LGSKDGDLYKSPTKHSKLSKLLKKKKKLEEDFENEVKEMIDNEIREKEDEKDAKNEDDRDINEDDFDENVKPTLEIIKNEDSLENKDVEVVEDKIKWWKMRKEELNGRKREKRK